MNESIILVMAAGQSRRFGSDKRQARLADGQTLLMATLSRVMSCEVDWRLLLREDDDPAALLGEAFACEHARRIWRAPQADNGLGASLGDAFRQLSDEAGLAHVQVAAVWLADMAQITAQTFHALQAQADDVHIVRPRLDGEDSRPGHPVLFGRTLWAELAALDGGEGAREVITRHLEALREVAVGDVGIHHDIDTPAMLKIRD
ncbi:MULTISPECIES: NTP transferase domain-containing protein [unclassified Cobetia]|uniref:nucleotidyltransferase family protein n=1 Tax=unclassified Cobetia TaxID=2609414 RepID=UPI002097D559|nr:MULTISPECIES: nucleotidyltransferase family protein [unclassified Cobetia]MCO7233977.1 nucleotidyltransferase family protein [Cobetia sp. Dlab-2-AX]MCO7237285.1 nucleotidyltransferase family protein [Cobetia sp. Dlab-2-U]